MSNVKPSQIQEFMFRVKFRARDRQEIHSVFAASEAQATERLADRFLREQPQIERFTTKKKNQKSGDKKWQTNQNATEA